ncbi:hypothetical protein BDN67DRAFT_179923 [Paxillus ammoniavirescens]|nr:hypothetical protein BDN67DRAFT_179923 [Paxillus ammoniavirescens]
MSYVFLFPLTESCSSILATKTFEFSDPQKSDSHVQTVLLSAAGTSCCEGDEPRRLPFRNNEYTYTHYRPGFTAGRRGVALVQPTTTQCTTAGHCQAPPEARIIQKVPNVHEYDQGLVWRKLCEAPLIGGAMKMSCPWPFVDTNTLDYELSGHALACPQVLDHGYF